MWFRSWGRNPRTERVPWLKIIAILFWRICKNKRPTIYKWRSFVPVPFGISVKSYPKDCTYFFWSNQTSTFFKFRFDCCCKWDDTPPNADTQTQFKWVGDNQSLCMCCNCSVKKQCLTTILLVARQLRTSDQHYSCISSRLCAHLLCESGDKVNESLSFWLPWMWCNTHQRNQIVVYNVVWFYEKNRKLYGIMSWSWVKFLWIWVFHRHISMKQSVTVHKKNVMKNNKDSWEWE